MESSNARGYGKGVVPMMGRTERFMFCFIVYCACRNACAHLFTAILHVGTHGIKADARMPTDNFIIVFSTSEYVQDSWKSDGQSCRRFKAMRKQHKFKGSTTIRWGWQFLPLVLTSRQFPLWPLDEVNMADRGQLGLFNSRVGTFSHKWTRYLVNILNSPSRWTSKRWRMSQRYEQYDL